MTESQRFSNLRAIANDRANEIISLLEKNKLWVELFSVDVYSEFSYAILVEIDGDWKHDHLYADNLVKKEFTDKGLIRISEVEFDDEDYSGDDYKSVHSYKFVF